MAYKYTIWYMFIMCKMIMIWLIFSNCGVIYSVRGKSLSAKYSITLESPLTVTSAKVLVMQAIENMIDYYENNFKTMNLDGIYGIRVLQGQLGLIVEEQDAIFTERLHSDLERLHKRASWIAEEAMRSVYDDNPAYFDQLRGIITQPVRLAKSYRLLNHNLAWQLGNSPPKGNFTEKLSDKCISELIGRPANDVVAANHDKCHVSNECYTLMFGKGQQEYELTHQLLYTFVAEQIGCLQSLDTLLRERGLAGGVNAVQLEFCTNVMIEMRAVIAKFNGEIVPPYRDLFMEQVFVCPVLGFMEFLHIDWLRHILQWQQPSGCYGIEKQDKRFPDYDSNDDDTEPGKAAPQSKVLAFPTEINAVQQTHNTSLVRSVQQQQQHQQQQQRTDLNQQWWQHQAARNVDKMKREQPLRQQNQIQQEAERQQQVQSDLKQYQQNVQPVHSYQQHDIQQKHQKSFHQNQQQNIKKNQQQNQQYNPQANQQRNFQRNQPQHAYTNQQNHVQQMQLSQQHNVQPNVQYQKWHTEQQQGENHPQQIQYNNGKLQQDTQFEQPQPPLKQYVREMQQPLQQQHKLQQPHLQEKQRQQHHEQIADRQSDEIRLIDRWKRSQRASDLQHQSRHLLVEKKLKDGCLSHKTAVAAGALSQYLRFLLLPGPPAFQRIVQINGVNQLYSVQSTAGIAVPTTPQARVIDSYNRDRHHHEAIPNDEIDPHRDYHYQAGQNGDDQPAKVPLAQVPAKAERDSHYTYYNEVKSDAGDSGVIMKERTTARPGGNTYALVMVAVILLLVVLYKCTRRRRLFIRYRFR